MSDENPGGSSGDKVWRTKDGRRIKISEMHTSHIENAINKIIREKSGLDALPYLYAEYDKRKEAEEARDAKLEKGDPKGVDNFIGWLDAHNKDSKLHRLTLDPYDGEFPYLEVRCQCGWDRRFALELGLDATKKIIEHHINIWNPIPLTWAKNNKFCKCGGNDGFYMVETPFSGLKRVICDCPRGREYRSKM